MLKARTDTWSIVIVRAKRQKQRGLGLDHRSCFVDFLNERMERGLS